MENVRLKYRFVIVIMISILVISTFGANKILIFRSEGVNFDEAIKGMRYNLDTEFKFSEVNLNRESSVEIIYEAMNSVKPNLVVLMNNRSISLYKKYQNSITTKTDVPVVALMAILVNDAIKGIKNATGIGYEIPIVTSVVNLRTIIGSNIKRVGIIHRSNLNNFLDINIPLCKNEGIELKNIEITKNRVKTELSSALKTLIKKDKIDALWIPNDNKLINNKLLTSVWLPFASRYKLPIIVGVASLVNVKYHFGNFAVIPDNVALGSQASDLIYDIQDNNWKVEKSGKTELPLSVYTIANYPDMNRYFNVSKDMLSGVDNVLE